MAVPRGVPVFNDGKTLDGPTCPKAPIENARENRRLSNGFSQPPIVDDDCFDLQQRIANSIKTKRVSESVHRAIELDDTHAYNGLMLIFASRLTERQRAGIAYAALSSLPDDHAYRTASLSIFGVWNGEVAS